MKNIICCLLAALSVLIFSGCSNRITKLELSALGSGTSYVFDIEAKDISTGGMFLNFHSEQSLQAIGESLDGKSELDATLYGDFLLVSKSNANATKDYYIFLKYKADPPFVYEYYVLTTPAIYVANDFSVGFPLCMLFPRHFVDLPTGDYQLYKADSYATGYNIDEFKKFYQDCGYFHIEEIDNGFIVTPNEKLVGKQHIRYPMALDFSTEGSVFVDFPYDEMMEDSSLWFPK